MLVTMVFCIIMCSMTIVHLPLNIDIAVLCLLSMQRVISWYVASFRYHVDGLVQERRNSSALAMGLRRSCTNPSMWSDCRNRYRPLGIMYNIWWSRMPAFDMPSFVEAHLCQIHNCLCETNVTHHTTKKMFQLYQLCITTGDNYTKNRFAYVAYVNIRPAKYLIDIVLLCYFIICHRCVMFKQCQFWWSSYFSIRC